MTEQDQSGRTGMTIRQKKKSLIRQDMLRQREALAPETCIQAAMAMRQRFAEFLLLSGLAGKPLKIAVYAAMRQELDLSPLWPDLMAVSDALYFPAVSGRGEAAELVFGQLPAGRIPDEFLIRGRFGIAEPPSDSWLREPPVLDLILLPGLAFDRSGNRLGWGRAFYDRFLSRLTYRPLLAGVAYSFQILPELLPAEPTDRPVDWLLTPDRCFRAERSAG